MDVLDDLKSIIKKIEDIENKIKETEELCETITIELNEIKYGLKNYFKS
jgi:hypothetical protein